VRSMCVGGLVRPGRNSGILTKLRDPEADVYGVRAQPRRRPHGKNWSTI
jgi:hypothetical protein